MILVVGGDSIIGRAVLAEAASKGIPCTSTSRSPRAEFFVDLAAPSDTWQLPANVRTAILCAAITGIANCENSPEETRRVNVEATIQLANRLASQGAKIVFLSSSQVFGRRIDVPREDSLPNPVSEYGKQKLAVEKYLQQEHHASQIIRLTKVVSPGMLLFRKWRTELSEGHRITASSDLYFSPITARLASEFLLKIALGNRPGVFHLSALNAISYLDAATYIAHKMNITKKLVQSVPAPCPITPDSSMLNCDRTRLLMNFTPPEAEEQLDSLVNEYF